MAERPFETIAKLRRQLVWAAKYGCAFRDHLGAWRLADLSNPNGEDDIEFDGTDAGLLEALDKYDQNKGA